MPTSTIWRRQLSSHGARPPSPTRPTGNSIERLSPPPFESFVTNNNHNTFGRSHSDGRRSQGLGLGVSGTSLNHGTSSNSHPDHLYLDQNGGAHVSARPRFSGQRSSTSSKNPRQAETSQNQREYKTYKSKNHTRSGSTIDDLANAAIATSPTFANGNPMYAFGSPTNPNIRRPTTSYVNGYGFDENSYERPAKRVKSDKVNSSDWSPQDDRPRTSHNYVHQSPLQEDAELLLNLSYGPRWNPQALVASPPAIPIQKTQDQEVTQGISISDVSIHAATTTFEAANIELGPERGNSVARSDSTVDMIDAQKEGFSDEPVKSEKTSPLIKIAELNKPTRSPTSKMDELPVPSAQQDIILSPAEQLQAGTLTMPAEVEVTAAPAPKKTRRVQPEVKAEGCAICGRMQRDVNDEDKQTQWIGCEHCEKWFHPACVGLNKQEVRSIDKYFCRDCEPVHGKTVFVRKSTRVRTAIDYAGLNQGVVKPSDTSSMHHYIQPIKTGQIKYLADDFARVRPELLTAEFWENMGGMKRPFVVPACWNPRFGMKQTSSESEHDHMEAEPLTDEHYVTFDAEGNTPNHVSNTSVITDDSIRTTSPHEEVFDCDQDYLDMVMPRDLTVRKVAELFGPHEPVPVIDVKSQETKGAFTLGDWATYYELEGEKPIRNVISLEVSNSRLGRLIRRPKVVREIDLETNVWDHEQKGGGNRRPVQFYCLMSVADSYTDFHIDFGGSSVYYHILKGVKTFFFIPPEDRYLKKYEEWCNSDTQNETWLGDLCHGNVTRVDLHEGDTAFIPAGWIHSVWTPEDSLVIGGNFLTHLDYELQLKVANIEKNTKVSPKFRYPFFQKVMWYALLKYLEDDPIPEEVMFEFEDDAEHRFLRANSVWHEIGELARTDEPGEAYYNARIYSQSELKGLPALRDYLYRTARIYADLPVPDINKKQIDAVKSSIPRGHGDPMQLIKQFAVWCAWKLGNEIVPDWVHSDQGLSGDSKDHNRAKKSEVFRAPPERVSARKASQLTPALSTPPVEDVVAVSPMIAQEAEMDEFVKKPKNNSKASVLKVACEPCRKRRIKCRHKDGDACAIEVISPAIKPRTYSNVSADASSLVPTSPPQVFQDVTSSANGETLDAANSTSDLAQAALASLSSQPSDPAQLTGSSVNGFSSKKGRSKACEECRKSKRRCVHDENGRVDPAKAAEPSKPRGSAVKRVSRPSEESITRNLKSESDLDSSLIDPSLQDVTNMIDMDANIDPALMADAFNNVDPMLDQEFQNQAIELSGNTASEHHDVDVKMDDETDVQETQEAEVTGSNQSALPVDLDIDAVMQMHAQTPTPLVTAQIAHLRQSPDLDISYSPITVDGHPIESTEKPDEDMTDAPSERSPRHSSRQPKPVGRYVPEDHRRRSISNSRSAGSGRGRRESSVSITDHAVNTIAGKHQSPRKHIGAVFPHSPGDMRGGQSADMIGRQLSRGSTADSDMTADERMARELQASENGLRRRTSVRA